jgi:hypothetical protein
MIRKLRIDCILWKTSVFLALSLYGLGQSSVSGGSLEGTVVDPSGAVIPSAQVEIHNEISGFRRATTTDSSGTFRFSNLPPNPYHLLITASGFALFHQDISVRSAVPLQLSLRMELETGKTSLNVSGDTAEMLENIPYAHTDIDRNMLDKLPLVNPASGFSEVLTLATPGVVADSNGFFHPLGDHAQASFIIDNQPISDQQSKQFSTQIPLNAIESFEAISGLPAAEYGDKTSLVINASTRSGLGHDKIFGSLIPHYGSFGTVGEEATFGGSRGRWGNFTAVNFTRSGRFLDSPEFEPLHNRGNNETFFDRIDFQPNLKNNFHLNLFAARNWFQVPNTYDQQALDQDQRQQARSFNIAGGWVRTLNANAVFTFNPYYRQDRIQYFPSANFLSDSPATMSQDRRLGNLGAKSDFSYVHGIHNLKIGGRLDHTFLSEQFSLGLTDPAFNPVCLTLDGMPVTDPQFTQVSSCGPAGFIPNPDLHPGLVPYDLTRGGSPFSFHDHTDIKQFSGFIEDNLTLGNLTASLGLRGDEYRGLSAAGSLQPRLGFSYHLKPTAMVFRASYARTFETPYNENLIVSSSTGGGGLAQNSFGYYGSTPLRPGNRNLFNIGFEQSIARIIVLEANYFWKFTKNAYDFDTLLNTPIYFPISWRQSKIDGLSARLSLIHLGGFSAFTVLGHSRARFFGPENGGILFNSPVDASVFRIDHDQAFQQTTQLRYQFHKTGPWMAFTWRYDSGQVAGAVPDIQTALSLTGDEQAAIGFYCGSEVATPTSPITSCSDPHSGATRLKIPDPGTANDDHNPPRITSRHLFDLGAGIDNLFRTERYRVTLRMTAQNLTNEVALYNFLSTFSGTHFVSPRSYLVELGFIF